MLYSKKQVRDLLLASGEHSSKLRMGPPECAAELVAKKVENPLDYSRVLKAALKSRGTDTAKSNLSHLYGLNFFNIIEEFSFFFLCDLKFSFSAMPIFLL